MAKILGITDNWRQNALFGLGLGFLFIFLNMLSPLISIGYPLVSFDVGQFLVIFVVAAIIEEAFFRGALLSYVDRNPSDARLVAAVAITAGLFSIMHFAAYGVALESAFIGAGLFGMVAGFITIWKKSVLPAIIMHAMFNAWLFAQANAVFGIAG